MFKLFDKDRPHLIHSSVHKYNSGYRVLNVKNRSKYVSTLTIEVETKGGEVSIYIDTSKDVHESHSQMKSQTLTYQLEKGESYKLTIISRRHVGKWVITTKANRNEKE